MRHYKSIDGEYITTIGIGPGNTEITEQEYNAIMDIIHNCPEAPEGYGYKLKTDLTWELYELPPMPEPEESIDAGEVIRLLNGEDE